MKITKKTFNYTAKLSANYQSVSVSQGFEFETDNSPEEIQHFNSLKGELIDTVNTQAKQAIDDVTKPKNLLSGGKPNEQPTTTTADAANK